MENALTVRQAPAGVGTVGRGQLDPMAVGGLAEVPDVGLTQPLEPEPNIAPLRTPAASTVRSTVATPAGDHLELIQIPWSGSLSMPEHPATGGHPDARFWRQ